jgi:LacI family transcriptional regulator
MNKKLSINDIAKQLNIAKSTVSFIINGKAKEKRITKELSEKVQKFIKEKGYKPSQLARSLSTGKTKMICLLVEKISDYFFSHIAYHLELLAYRNGYKIIYCSTDNDPKKTKELISMLIDRHVDGYIITPSVGIESEIKELIKNNLPVVLFDRYLPGIATNYVLLDNFKGTYNATAYLVKSGCKEIAFITLDSSQTQMIERQSGYLAAIQQSNFESHILKIPFNNDIVTSTKQIQGYISENKGLDGIIFATNYLALSGLSAINELKLNIPEDLSIVAFDDHEIFSIYHPKITAIAQPIEEMANQLFKIILDKLECKSPLTDLKQIVVPSEFRIRNSTKLKQLKGVDA